MGMLRLLLPAYARKEAFRQWTQTFIGSKQ